MSRELFEKLFDYLDQQLEENKCKHNLDLSALFLNNNSCPVEPVLEWLCENGGGCDC